MPGHCGRLTISTNRVSHNGVVVNSIVNRTRTLGPGPGTDRPEELETTVTAAERRPGSESGSCDDTGPPPAGPGVVCSVVEDSESECHMINLRNHQAIIQPRLYDCSGLTVTVTQSTLNTPPESTPQAAFRHRPADSEADPPWRLSRYAWPGLIILTDYD